MDLGFYRCIVGKKKCNYPLLRQKSEGFAIKTCPSKGAFKCSSRILEQGRGAK